MGILNRAFNIAKAKFNNSTNNSRFDENYFESNENNEEIKKIIEELNADTSVYNSDSNFKFNFDTNSNVSSSVNYNNYITKDVLEAYEIIGADINNSIEEIKLKFKLAIKRNHPDMLINSTEVERKKAEENTIKILNAYKIILAYNNKST